MKVLFLDIDGVLNDGVAPGLDPARVALNNGVLTASGANVVLSTS